MTTLFHARAPKAIAILDLKWPGIEAIELELPRLSKINVTLTVRHKRVRHKRYMHSPHFRISASGWAKETVGTQEHA